MSSVDEIRVRVAFQRDIRYCNIFCFTETWLSGDMLSESVQPLGFFVRSADRNKHLIGKKKVRGVCFMINDSWCNYNNIQELKSFCSPGIEFLTILTIKFRPYYLPREFSSVIVTAVYIPPKPTPQQPSMNPTGLNANWKTYIWRLHLLSLGNLTKQI
jgi:hypothetical protein